MITLAATEATRKITAALTTNIPQLTEPMPFAATDSLKALMPGRNHGVSIRPKSAALSLSSHRSAGTSYSSKKSVRGMMRKAML